MPYQRGSGPIEVEVSRLQSWTETADIDLYGRDGRDLGVIREHRDDRESRKTREEDDRKYNRRILALVAALGTAAPILIKFLEIFHILPK